ncbi:hypothetical protein ACLB2K_046607 [Fragaria x ananassa]
MALTYHGGSLLQGDLPVSILWYGNFSPAQKSIIADFLLSLNHKGQKTAKPSVTQWWNSVQTYMKKAGQKPTNVSLSTQLSDHNYSLGKTLKKSQITELARGANFGQGRLTLVLTAPDVAVEGFCMSNCGFHYSNRKSNLVFIWVGNSATVPGGGAASACTGVYGKGAYLGYAGELLVDANSGASYHAVGVNGRKYLLPALFDPYTSQCETIV